MTINILDIKDTLISKSIDKNASVKWINQPNKNNDVNLQRNRRLLQFDTETQIKDIEAKIKERRR